MYHLIANLFNPNRLDYQYICAYLLSVTSCFAIRCHCSDSPVRHIIRVAALPKTRLFTVGFLFAYQQININT